MKGKKNAKKSSADQADPRADQLDHFMASQREHWMLTDGKQVGLGVLLREIDLEEEEGERAGGG